VTTFASYDGTVLSYEQVGEGPPLVCVPGGPGRSAGYLEDLGGLARERTLLLLDPRAVGRSEVPSDPATLRFDRLAADIEAMRAHLGLEQLDLLGHSAGTIVAQAWAAQHPSSVGRLVLVTPADALQGGSRSDVAAIRTSRADEPWYADASEADAALPDAPPSQRAALERATRPFFYGRWDERTQEHAASADRQSSKRAVLGFAAGGEDVDGPAMLAALEALEAPVLVVGGELDGLTGVTAAQAVAATFRNGSAAIIPRAGHFPWVDEPEAFVAAVAPFMSTL
jgi:proline iminopeptidase